MGNGASKNLRVKVNKRNTLFYVRGSERKEFTREFYEFCRVANELPRLHAIGGTWMSADEPGTMGPLEKRGEQKPHYGDRGTRSILFKSAAAGTPEWNTT